MPMWDNGGDGVPVLRGAPGSLQRTIIEAPIRFGFVFFPVLNCGGSCVFSQFNCHGGCLWQQSIVMDRRLETFRLPALRVIPEIDLALRRLQIVRIVRIEP
jgi:hypothetical protein